jgi:hypothetical protein
MVKGVLISFGIIIVLIAIPIVHIVGIPFGPFIGGYYGITAASDSTASSERKALIFGLLTAILMLLVFVVAVAIVDSVFELSDKLRVIIWVGGVGVLPFYYGSMAGLGAWYAELKGKG